MTRRALLGAVAFIVAAVAIWWVLFVVVPRWYRSGDPAEQQAGASPQAAQGQTPQKKITATLYYVSEDGMSLVPAQREVPFGDPITDQAKYIVEAQLATVEAPLASAVPSGTKVRAVYVTERGDAFVDLSSEATINHPGGALDELFTVYTIVNALTVNLPAIQRVQILVDGKETDTLAGHVDLRQPLSKNLNWVKTDNPS